MFLFLKMSVSYDIYFGMDIDAKALTNILADGFTEFYNLLTCSTTSIDEDESLAVMDACTSLRTALPTTLVNHPSGRNFLVVGIYIIMWHVRILR